MDRSAIHPIISSLLFPPLANGDVVLVVPCISAMPDMFNQASIFLIRIIPARYSHFDKGARGDFLIVTPQIILPYSVIPAVPFPL